MFFLSSLVSLSVLSLHSTGEREGTPAKVKMLRNCCRWKTSNEKQEKYICLFSQEIKGETVDEDLQNLDPAFLQGMNLHNLVCSPFLYFYILTILIWNFTTWLKPFIIVLMKFHFYSGSWIWNGRRGVSLGHIGPGWRHPCWTQRQWQLELWIFFVVEIMQRSLSMPMPIMQSSRLISLGSNMPFSMLMKCSFCTISKCCQIVFFRHFHSGSFSTWLKSLESNISSQLKV